MAEGETQAQTGGQTSQSSQGESGQSQASGAQGASAAASSPTQTSQAAEQTQATAPSRPDWLPEEHWDATKGIKDSFGAHFTELTTRLAAEEVRRNALPQKPEDVKLDLPKEFKLPQGVEFKLDPAKPEFGKFREIAVKNGLSQEAVTQLMGVYAETLVGSESMIQQARAAEVAKLGANGTARITALNTWLAGMVGTDDAKQLGGMMVTAGIVGALEKLVSKFANQGAGSFSQAHRDVEPQGRVSEEQWQKMGPAERLNYARQFPQEQFANGRGR